VQTPTDSRFQQLIKFRPNRNQVVSFTISLILAIILWGWVTQIQDPFDSKVLAGNTMQAGSLPDNLQIVTSLPDARVTLEGSRSEVQPIRQSDITVTADTSGINEAGTFQVPVIVSGADVSEVTVEPGQITIQVDERMSRVVPVRVSTGDSASVAIGNEIVPSVSQVTVSGPRSAVERVTEVILPVPLDEAQVSDYDSLVTPYAVDAEGLRINEVEILPSTVPVTVEVERRGKSISVIPNITGVPAEGYTVQVRRALPDTIVVDGPDEALADLLFVNTEAVDVSDATQSISTTVGIADLPEGVTIIDPPSGEIEVRVAIEDTSTSSQTLSGLPIEVLGLEPGMEAAIDPTTISIQVSAPLDILQIMTPSDITVLVDLTDLGPGTHVIMPEVTLPQGATWASADPSASRILVVISEDPDATPVAISATPQATPP
jgi:YbbR domain-containing protein